MAQKEANVSRRRFLKSAGTTVIGATIGFGRVSYGQPLGVVSDGAGGYIVDPSNDISGITDAQNLQWAVDNTIPGATVSLTAGHFYTSREIYSEGFDGTIQGAGMTCGTVVEAVRRGPNPGEGFEPVFKFPPYASPNIAGEPRPSIFMFVRSDDSDLTITDMSLICNDPEPCDPVKIWNIPDMICLASCISDFYGYGKTTTIERVRMQSVPTIDPNNVDGTFSSAGGIISWPGDYESGGGAGPGEGVLGVQDCEFEKLAFGLYVLRYSGGLSSVTIEGVHSADTAHAAWVDRVTCPVEFRSNVIERMLRSGLVLGALPTVRVIKNVFRDFNIFGAEEPVGGWPRVPICLYYSIENGIIENNRFININRELAEVNPAIAAVWVTPWGNSHNLLRNNNYSLSGLPGWDLPDYTGGPGCILVGQSSDGNVLSDQNYPPITDMCHQIKNMGVDTIMPPGWQGVCNPVLDAAIQEFEEFRPRI